MNNKSNSSDRPIKHQADFGKDLALAIEKLTAFTEQETKEIELKDSPFQITMERARSIISLAFSAKSRERERKRREFIQTEILKAIQTVQKNYLYIQKLKKGDESEKAVADSALKTIERYNNIVKKSSEKHLKISSRISNFIEKQYGLQIDTDIDRRMIQLPLEAAHASTFKANSSYKKINYTVVPFIQQHDVNQLISNQEADAFRVKAISLLKNNGIRFTTVAEEFQAIRSTPIQATIDSNDLKRIMMMQVLKPFPGETIAFKGEFFRDNEALHKSVPVTESFEVFTKSDQTGFPHPIQHTGFSLADCMIPQSPANLQNLKKFSIVFKLKQEIALKLLPKGSLILRAKEILKKKREIFEENKNELLEAHLAFYNALLHAFPKEMQPNSNSSVIFQFFKEIPKFPSVFDYLSQTVDTILHHFVAKPFEVLKDDFLNQKVGLLSAHSFETSYTAALHILEREQLKPLPSLPKSALDFVLCIGSMIGSAANQIILQHLSETIGFTPPKLEKHEELVQIALYKHLISFQRQLSENLSKDCLLNHFRSEIASDTSLFLKSSLTDELPVQIMEELKNYYK